MGSLIKQIRGLLPIDSKSQVDKVIGLLYQRNTVLDAQIRQRICSYIEDPQMKTYFTNRTDGMSHAKAKAALEAERKPVYSYIGRFMPLDSIAKINNLIGAIKDAGGIITSEEKIDVYLRIWGAELKSYWSAKCLNELTVIYSARSQKKMVKVKKEKKYKPAATKAEKNTAKRTPGIINPNSTDYRSQVLKENLRSKYEGFEYGLSDW